MYRFWQWLQVSAYTPLFEYLSACWRLCAGDSKRSMLWMVLNATPTLVCLNRFVTERTSRPTKVKSKHVADYGIIYSMYVVLDGNIQIHRLYYYYVKRFAQNVKYNQPFRGLMQPHTFRQP
jgi:hypothetical protein